MYCLYNNCIYICTTQKQTLIIMKKAIEHLDTAIERLRSLLPARQNTIISIRYKGIDLDCEIKGDFEEYYLVSVYTEDSDIDILPLLCEDEIYELTESKINDLP